MMIQTLPVQLKSLKNGEYFKRKPEAIKVTNNYSLGFVRINRGCLI